MSVATFVIMLPLRESRQSAIVLLTFDHEKEASRDCEVSVNVHGGVEDESVDGFVKGFGRREGSDNEYAS